MSRLNNPPAFQILSGFGSPLAGSGLEPLNGSNDPWRWSSFLVGWVSPPVDVEWEAGATIPSFGPPTAGILTLYLGTFGDNPTDISTVAPHPFRSEGLEPATDVSAAGSGETFDHFIREPSTPATDAGGGSGTAFLVWRLIAELNDPNTTWTGDNTDVLPAESRTVEDILGSDFTVTPSEWSEEALGHPGDWYIDMGSTTGDLWGPRSAESWGGYPEFQVAQVLTAPDGTLHRLKVANDGTLSTEPA